MDGLLLTLVVLFGSCSYYWISASVLEVTVGPGDNITLYCDCKMTLGKYIMWFRNCSHENQPSLALQVNYETTKPPRYEFVSSHSSDSYDLLITNATDSDEGLYYCGTTINEVEDKKYISSRSIYSYGNVTTRIMFKPHHCDCCGHHETPQHCGVCRTLLISLCPALAVLSSVLSSCLVYHLCHKPAEEPQVEERRFGNNGQTGRNQDEDVCYAALEIHPVSQRPKKKTQTSDFSTYSAIKTSRSKLE